MFRFMICFVAGLGAGLGTGFAGMSAAAVMMAAAVSILLFLLERWNERQET